MSKAKEIKVGLLVVVSIVVFYTGFSYLKGQDFFSNENAYFVEYDKIDGLTPGNPVMFNGFAVGRVESIEMRYDAGNRLRVKLVVDSDLQLKQGTQGKLTSALLDGMSIVLMEGTNEGILEDGSEINGIYEISITSLITEKAIPVLSNIDTTFMKINGFFDQNAQNNFGQMMRNYNMMSANLLKASARVDKLIKDKEGNVNAAITKIDQLSDSLMLVSSQANLLMKKLNTFGDSLNSMDLRATIAQVQRLASNMADITDKVNNGEGTMGKLINEDSTYNNLNVALLDLDELLKNFNSNPKHFLAPLGKSSKKIEKDRKKAEQQAIVDQRIEEEVTK